MNYTPTGFSGQSNPQPTLKRCPFCDGYVKLTENHGIQGDVDYIIWCAGCSMEFTKARWFNGYDKTKIIEDWNRRVNE